MKANFWNVSIVCLVLVLVGVACSTFTKGKAAGERAVEKFHAQLNDEKFEEIYNQSASEFQKSDDKEEIIKFLQAIRRKLGTVNKATSQGWHVNTTPTGTVITMQYETEFANDKGNESFTFFMNGEDAQLAGYHINAKKLVTE